MNDRTLDQALDMTPAERAELRSRVELLHAGGAQDDRVVEDTQLRTAVLQDRPLDVALLLGPDAVERRHGAPTALRALQMDIPGGSHV